MNNVKKYQKRRITRLLSRWDSLDSCAQQKVLADRKDYNRDADEGDWITVKGAHILIGEGGNAKGGAGGKFNGKNFSNARSVKSGSREKIGHNGATKESEQKKWIQGKATDKNYAETNIAKAVKSGNKKSIARAVKDVGASKKNGSGFRVGDNVYVKNADGSWNTRKGGKGEWSHISEKEVMSRTSEALSKGENFSYDRYDWSKSTLPSHDDAKSFIKRSLGGKSGSTNCEEAEHDRAESSTLRANTKDGKLTPEREAIHEQIVANAFSVKDKNGNVIGEVKKATGKPTYTFLGGGPAAGKSTITNSLKQKGVFPKDDEAVTINPDDYKEMFPEAKKWAENPPDDPDYSGWANNTHEESSAIAKRINSVACGNGYNVVNDACNDGGASKMIKKIEEARNQGMEVAGVYVTCPTQEALKRNEGRSSSEGSKGRLPLPDVVNDTHIGVSRIFEEIAPHFDHVELYDTMRKNKDGTPLMIASCKRGEKITVHDQTAYQEFLDKGKELTTKEKEARAK